MRDMDNRHLESNAVKRAQREFYDAGEYHALSAVLAPVATVIVERTAVGPGSHVLDVGAGDGNVAVEAVRRGATCVATDLSARQVERGLSRCRREGIPVDWQVADVEDLPFADGTFSHVLSAFAAIVAPHPDAAAREMVRICRPGGIVAMTAWTPGSFMAELAEAVRRAAPEDFPFPDREFDWGIEEVARERFAPYAEEISCTRFPLSYDPEMRAAAGASDFVVQYFAGRLPEAARPRIAQAREEVMRRFSVDGRITAEYLLVIARTSPREGSL